MTATTHHPSDAGEPARNTRSPLGRTLVTCLGDCLLDFLPIPATETSEEITGFSMHVGGAILNVAVGLARLRVPVAFAGKVSADFFGKRIRSRLCDEGVDTRFLLSSSRPSTLAFVTRRHPQPEYLFYGEATADTQLTTDELPPAFFAETGILHIGSTSLLRGTTPAAVLSAARDLKGRALLSLDPNIRRMLIADEGAYRALLAELLGLADVVKLSDADLEWLAPGMGGASEEDLESEARRLLRMGDAHLAVVTRGERGLLGVTRDGPTITLPAFPITVLDTVGAGDALAAGLLAELWRAEVRSPEALAGMSTESVEHMLRVASAVAALTCAQAGANPPTQAEVDTFVRQIPPSGHAD